MTAAYLRYVGSPKAGMSVPLGLVVGYLAGHTEYHLRSGGQSAPDRELAANVLCTLTHASQPKVPGGVLIPQKVGIDALPVIPYAQLELPLTIPKLHLDAARLGVKKCVSQRFARNPVDLIADQRS